MRRAQRQPAAGAWAHSNGVRPARRRGPTEPRSACNRATGSTFSLQTCDTTRSSRRARRNPMRRILVTLIVASGLALSSSAAAAAQAGEPGPELLRLECSVVARDPAAVACAWSPSHGRAFDAYRLVRFDDANGRVT